jgi:hypothetical protein
MVIVSVYEKATKLLSGSVCDVALDEPPGAQKKNVQIAPEKK